MTLTCDCQQHLAPGSKSEDPHFLQILIGEGEESWVVNLDECRKQLHHSQILTELNTERVGTHLLLLKYVDVLNQAKLAEQLRQVICNLRGQAVLAARGRPPGRAKAFETAAVAQEAFD